ncbi:hypothetical protein C8Q74DRAFT_1445786 [Fomes fomentarius]|nr:hypothetical protein C8Q74DRAFT_1445786 [Fomes fomentarius]
MMCAAFPAEIFLAIKTCIPLADLRTHVCYYTCSSRIAALYDSEPNPDSFWHHACWSCGIGCSKQMDGKLRQLTFWRDLAIKIIRCCGFCVHPQCGEALLEYNRKRIAQALQTVDPFSIKQDWSIDDLDIEIAGFTHAVLPQLAFLSRYVPRGPLAALRQAYVRDAGVKGIPSNPAMLEDHALLLRSFATEIPTDMIELGLGDGQIRSRVPSCNPRGVTVLDVVLTIYAELDVPLAYENVWDFVRGHQEHFTDALWAQESREVFGYLRTLRAVHNTCPVSRFGYNWPMAMRVRHPYFMIYLK